MPSTHRLRDFVDVRTSFALKAKGLVELATFIAHHQYIGAGRTKQHVVGPIDVNADPPQAASVWSRGRDKV